MAYRIQISLPAKQDAKGYADYIRDEHKSPEAARGWLEGLYAAIKQLTELPNRFSVIPEAEELGFPYRSFNYHSHRIVYAVYDSEQRLVIHRVYHGAREPLTKKDIQ